MSDPRRIAILMTMCLTLSACAETVTTDTTDPLRGVTWAPVLEWSQDHGWVNGVALSNDVMVVSVDASPSGWVCTEIMGHEYEIHLGTVTDRPTG